MPTFGPSDGEVLRYNRAVNDISKVPRYVLRRDFQAYGLHLSPYLVAHSSSKASSYQRAHVRERELVTPISLATFSITISSRGWMLMHHAVFRYYSYTIKGLMEI